LLQLAGTFSGGLGTCSSSVPARHPRLCEGHEP
jgi:hypothetical protein